jgi:hypothetical protein
MIIIYQHICHLGSGLILINSNFSLGLNISKKGVEKRLKIVLYFFAFNLSGSIYVIAHAIVSGFPKIKSV